MRKDKRMLEQYIPVGSSIVATRTIFPEAHLVGRQYAKQLKSVD